jgi:hypothetical protein
MKAGMASGSFILQHPAFETKANAGSNSNDVIVLIILLAL